MSTRISRTLATVVTLPAMAAGIGVAAPSAQAASATHTYQHGGYAQAHFATAADCTNHSTSAVKTIKAKHGTSVNLGPCHAVSTALATATGRYTYNVTYQATKPVWASDTDLGSSSTAGQHSFYETGHASSAAAANSAIAAAKSRVTHTVGARVTWSSGAIKSKEGDYVWEVDSTSRYTPSTSAIESSMSPGVTDVLLLDKTSGTTAPTTGAIDKGVTQPGGATSGWTSGNAKPTQPANPTIPTTTTTNPGGSTTTTTTQPGTGTVTSTTTTPSGSTTSEKIGVAGIDISPHTVLNDYAGWKNKGIGFLFAKATEGTYNVSKQHSAQMAGAKQAGILAGSYDFANPANNSAQAEFNYFMAHGGGWKPNSGMMPDALDLEYNPYGQTCYNMSKAQLTKWANTWIALDYMKTGSYPFLYSTNGWINQCLDVKSLNPHTMLWMARYASTPGTVPQPWKVQTIWQNAAINSKGYDTDIFNGTPTSLHRLSAVGIQ